MKPRVLALDFDGTIAVNDTIDVDVAAAIQEARWAGLCVVLSCPALVIQAIR